MKHTKTLTAAAVLTIGAGSGFLAVNAQQAPFGDADSVAFADSLWAALEDARLVGENAVRSHAFIGSDPHGAVLEQTETTLSVAGRTDTVIVKHNYMRPEGGLSTDEVTNGAWDENLAAVTVMLRRSPGYNDEAGNWFWAKYLADGSLDTTPQGAQMAGRVTGCIDCHADADGDDFVFMHDRYGSD